MVSCGRGWLEDAMRGTVGQTTAVSAVDPGRACDAGGSRSEVTGPTLEASRGAGSLAMTGWYWKQALSTHGSKRSCCSSGGALSSTFSHLPWARIQVLRKQIWAIRRVGWIAGVRVLVFGLLLWLVIRLTLSLALSILLLPSHHFGHLFGFLVVGIIPADSKPWLQHALISRLLVLNVARLLFSHSLHQESQQKMNDRVD